MAYPTPIEWTDATWNPVGGCSITSPACGPCYAQALAGGPRLRHHPLYAGTTTPTLKGKPVFNGTLTALPVGHPGWTWPLRWRGAPKPLLGPGKPSLIFLADMSDLFHEDRDLETIDRTVASILYSRHVGQLLTKRPDVMEAYLWELATSGRWLGFVHAVIGTPNFVAWSATFDAVFLPRLWLGFSAERQREFDERWPAMRELAGRGFTIFCSYEPAMGPLVLPDDFLALGPRAQLIAGGMSGPEAEPAHPDWFRAVRDQCAVAGGAFFFKQWGEWIDHGHALDAVGPDNPLVGDARQRTRASDAGLKVLRDVTMIRVGKRAAGRLLDGRTHDGLPDTGSMAT